MQAARGVYGSTYNKALASLKSFTPEQVVEMEEAADFLKQSQGALLCLSFVCTVASQHEVLLDAGSQSFSGKSVKSKSVPLQILVGSRQMRQFSETVHTALTSVLLRPACGCASARSLPRRNMHLEVSLLHSIYSPTHFCCYCV